MKINRKVILIGLDGLMPEQVIQYRNDIPELDELMTQAFFSPALSSPFTCTATNWHTIATGSWMRTHGITSFWAHLPGMELGAARETFNSDLCQSEFFWHAADRQDKRTILINYPTAFPNVPANGIAIGGDGLSSSAWNVGNNKLYSTNRHNPDNCNTHKIYLRPASDWKNLPPDIEVKCEGILSIDTQMDFTWDMTGMGDGESIKADKGKIMYILVFARNRQMWVLLATEKDANNAITELSEGQWSGWVEEELDNKRYLRQYKALEISPDGEKISIYGTIGSTLSGWGSPHGIEQKIIENAGGYVEALECSPHSGVHFGWFNEDTAMEILQIQSDWLCNCAEYLTKSQPWDSMFIQYHAPDGYNHVYLKHLESPDRITRETARNIFRNVIRLLFKTVKRIRTNCADDNTVVCVVSDHGNMPINKLINVMQLFLRKGWTRITHDQDTGKHILDTRRSVAVQGQHGIWLNLRGREKYGCVSPGREYEKLRDEIIAELLQMRDADTGEVLFETVARKEAFYSMGIGGEREQDIITFARPYYFCGFIRPDLWNKGIPEGYLRLFNDPRETIPLKEVIDAGYIWDLTAVHWHLPNASTDYSSLRACFFLVGKGVKTNTCNEGHVNLVDVAPTMAHILGMQPPIQSEGRIIHEAFIEQES